MKQAVIIVIVIWTALVSSWIVNLNKLMSADFEPSYKEEIIHGIGLVPPISLFTVWYNKEEG